MLSYRQDTQFRTDTSYEQRQHQQPNMQHQDGTRCTSDLFAKTSVLRLDYHLKSFHHLIPLHRASGSLCQLE